MKPLMIILLAVFQLQACSQDTSVDMKKLVYVMDPQCGWCYGNSDNITAVYNEFSGDYEMEILVGGMWLKENAPVGGAELSRFIEAHSPRMEQTTGADVGTGYYDRVKDSSYPFSSLEPSAAIVLVKSMAPEKAFLFTKNVQRALFAEGKRLDELSTYLPILESMSLDVEHFKTQWLSEANMEQTYAEFSKAGSMARGFPTLILEDNGSRSVLASGYFQLAPMVNALKQYK